MVRVVPTGWNVGEPQKGSERILQSRVSISYQMRRLGPTSSRLYVARKSDHRFSLTVHESRRITHTLMLLVACTSPEVPNFLWPDGLVAFKWRTLQRGGWKLKNRQRWCICGEWLRNARNERNQGRKRQRRGLKGQSS